MYPVINRSVLVTVEAGPLVKRPDAEVADEGPMTCSRSGWQSATLRGR